MSPRTLTAAVLVGVVCAVIGLALWVVGPPGDARARRFDEQRVGDLRAIAAAVNAYHGSRKSLPEDLAAITEWPDRPVTLRDPENNAPYVYRVLDEYRFELCAEFARPSEPEPTADAGFWSHPGGAHCFQVMAE